MDVVVTNHMYLRLQVLGIRMDLVSGVQLNNDFFCFVIIIIIIMMMIIIVIVIPSSIKCTNIHTVSGRRHVTAYLNLDSYV